jgi:uncharacterized protein (TIGR02722 family)
MKATLLLTVFVFTLSIFLLGCKGSKVYYGDPHEVETMTVDFGSTDLQMIAEKMVNSLLEHSVIKEGDRPVVFVQRIKNKTSEHIDTKSITDKIRTALIRSGKVRFTAVSDIPQEIVERLEYHQESGMVDPVTRKNYGKQIGSDYILYGEITSITKQKGRKTDVYYKITLNLVDVETAIIEWADEKEIRKGEQRKVFGP